MIGMFKNVQISDCNVGISMPSDAPVVFDGLVIQRCQQAIELRNPASLFGMLGLPAETPPNIVEEALNLLLAHANEPRNARAEVLSKSRLGAFLGGAANLASIFGALIQVQESGIVGSVVEALHKL